MHNQLGSARPPISLIDTEAETLSALATAWLERSTLGAKLLLQELERAETYDKTCVPPHVATMMSRVVFLDEATGKEHEIQLVYPKEADSEHHRISVLTPIGAALIGMPRGGWIDWPNRAGEYRRLRILEIIQPRAEAGE
jgi:regulator of nucleoside diphosphate kinase